MQDSQGNWFTFKASEIVGLEFLRRAVEQNRRVDLPDMRLILRDFVALEADRDNWANEHSLAIQLMEGFKKRVREAEARCERLERAANRLLEDVTPVPYKGYEVTAEEFEAFVEALAVEEEV
jgi:hypothetical protein